MKRTIISTLLLLLLSLVSADQQLCGSAKVDRQLRADAEEEQVLKEFEGIHVVSAPTEEPKS